MLDVAVSLHSLAFGGEYRLASLVSIVHERYLLAVARGSPLSLKSEIDIEDIRSEKIISFSRQNLSYSERYLPRSSRSTI